MQLGQRNRTVNPAGSPKIFDTTPRGAQSEKIWEEREKRLEELLEKDGGPNPQTKEDFNRLLEEMARRNSR